MYQSEFIRQWKHEEEIARIHGWDFSHVDGRCLEDPLPWSYREQILTYLKPEMKLLDVDTGGGEFLLSLNHPHEHTWVTEGYPPNAALCRETLAPLGITVTEADADGPLPFPDNSFDMVINRHGDLNPGEFYRILKPGGLFVSQQVGAENDREFVTLLFGKELPMPFPEQYLDTAISRFRAEGFEILDSRECHAPIGFTDVGALVWFARILPWEFPDFSVEGCLPQLWKAQEICQREGIIRGTVHRFLLTARK